MDDDSYGQNSPVYIENNRFLSQKSLTLINNSKYFATQQGSPCIVTITGPSTSTISWKIVQDGNTIASDSFNISLTSNQKLVVSSYPNNQFARLYNPDGSYVDISQYQDFTKSNYVLIPEGESTVLFNIDNTAQASIVFKEERLLV
ncbi:hypothetical protein ATX69_09700 [Oenococcus oeni]|uniref:hypothetical protein n=1 Tax=Oenococcus oeni TaxID=1247 RepID=UPI0008F8CD95|nr:hypothetical protein [Oenococcus oeni]OIM32208.1 hypothetical protein ATX69_09700 [Oenococcus oeni]